MSAIKGAAVLTLAASAVAFPVNLSERSANVAATYQAYRGDGTVASGWPSKDQWVSTFDEMWNINYPLMLASNNHNAEETNLIKPAINQAQQETGVDARFILTIVMQESGGAIRVGTTSYGNSGDKSGLMQAHGGPSCANKNPCTYDDIFGMIIQGTANGSEGVNLKDLMQKSGKPEPADYSWAARYYNSGAYSMTADCHDNLSCSKLATTVSYASDTANRLRGLTDTNGARAGGNTELFKIEAC